MSKFAYKAYTLADYPRSFFSGVKIISSECALSIAKKKVAILLRAKKELPYKEETKHNSLYSYAACWLGVLHYLEGSRDWDVCYGVNNPFLMHEIVATN